MTTRLIAIDGPAGCGKSTVSRELAKVLDGVMFSSGTVYRGVTLVALDAGINLEDSSQILRLFDQHAISNLIRVLQVFAYSLTLFIAISSFNSSLPR